MGLVARAERHLAAGAHGTRWVEVVRDGAALCAPGPFVAGRIERQASKLIEEAPQVQNVAKNTTFSLRSVH
jgi:hypothetical protein